MFMVIVLLSHTLSFQQPLNTIALYLFITKPFWLVPSLLKDLYQHDAATITLGEQRDSGTIKYNLPMLDISFIA